jgi:hypothetical protein
MARQASPEMGCAQTNRESGAGTLPTMSRPTGGGAANPAAARASARAVLTVLAVEARARLAAAANVLHRPALLAFVIDPTGEEREYAISVVSRHVGAPVYRVDMSTVVPGDTTKENFTRMFFAADRAGVILYLDKADALFGAAGSKEAHPLGHFEPGFVLERLDAFAGVVIAAVDTRESISPRLLQRARHVVDFTAKNRQMRLELPSDKD